MIGIVCAFLVRLSGDPELRFTADSKAMLSFCLAVEDARRQEGAPAEWVRVTA